MEVSRSHQRASRPYLIAVGGLFHLNRTQLVEATSESSRKARRDVLRHDD